jgi:hypothetical protein
MNSFSNFPQLWTVWLERSDEYTLLQLALVTSASDESAARQTFGISFGPELASHALILRGVNRNHVTGSLFAEVTLARVEKNFVPGQDVLLRASLSVGPQ